MSDRFDRYVATLIATWRAFAAAGGGDVVHTAGYACARHPNPIFNNALLFEPDGSALAAIVERFDDLREWALWTCDRATSAFVESAGLRRDVVTTAMMADLGALGPPHDVDVDVDVQLGADPVDVAALNALPASLVAGVVGLEATVVAAGASGLLSFRHDDDVNISFVATRPDARGTGLASAALSATLLQARSRGVRTASLQATPMGLGVYRRLGFVPIGEWQEWTPAAPAVS
jgi:GNAT superfamily N-acetyltransferase